MRARRGTITTFVVALLLALAGTVAPVVEPVEAPAEAVQVTIAGTERRARIRRRTRTPRPRPTGARPRSAAVRRALLPVHAARARWRGPPPAAFSLT